MMEIYSHDTVFSEDDESEDVFIISGKDWENEPFKLYLRLEDVRNLLWQMSFLVS